MIEAVDLDTDSRRPILCPTCASDVSIDPDEGDIGYLRCDKDETHLWRLSTVMDRQ